MKPLSGLTRKQKLIILACVGVIVLLVTTASQSQSILTTSENTSVEAFEKAQEKRLKAVIEKIAGVGEVYVMITASTSAERVIEKEVTTSTENIQESDAQGGTRSSASQNTSEAALYEQDGQMPYVIKEIQPKIEGVAVAAQGADNSEIVREITETVAVLFDVPVHKIKVVKLE